MLLYIMLPYLMLIAALSNAVCLHNAFLPLVFVFMLCLGLLTQFVVSNISILNVSVSQPSPGHIS